MMEWQNVKSFVKQSPDISVSAYLRSAYKIKGLSEIASSRWSHCKYSTSLFLAKDNMLCKFSCLIILAGQFTSCEVFVNF